MEQIDPLVPTLPIPSLLYRVNTICCVICLLFEFQKIGLLLATVFQNTFGYYSLRMSNLFVLEESDGDEDWGQGV